MFFILLLCVYDEQHTEMLNCCLFKTFWCLRSGVLLQHRQFLIKQLDIKLIVLVYCVVQDFAQLRKCWNVRWERISGSEKQSWWRFSGCQKMLHSNKALWYVFHLQNDENIIREQYLLIVFWYIFSFCFCCVNVVKHKSVLVTHWDKCIYLAIFFATTSKNFSHKTFPCLHQHQFFARQWFFYFVLFAVQFHVSTNVFVSATFQLENWLLSLLLLSVMLTQSCKVLNSHSIQCTCVLYIYIILMCAHKSVCHGIHSQK